MADYPVFQRPKIRVKRGEVFELRGTWPSPVMKSLVYDQQIFELHRQERESVGVQDGGAGFPSTEVFVLSARRIGSSEIDYCYHAMLQGGKVHNAERYHVEVTE